MAKTKDRTALWVIIAMLILISILLLLRVFGVPIFSVFGVGGGGENVDVAPIAGITSCEDYEGMCGTRTSKGFIEEGVYENCFGTYPSCSCGLDTFWPATCTDGKRDTKSCGNWDIISRFTQWFGGITMNIAQASCESNPLATWTGVDSEVSCANPAALPFDCDGDYATEGKEICENMDATWTCEPTRGYVGCYCPDSGGAPDYFDEQEEEQEEEDGQGELELRIFVTDNQWTGPMGGLAGADEKCEVSATFAGLGGGWKAILSDSSTNAIDRVPAPRTPHRYVRLDGVKVADSKADMFDGSLDAPININEHLGVENGDVWTGSTVAGVNDGNNCHDWGWVDEIGMYGTSSASDVNWIDTTTQHCSSGARIYCIDALY